MYRNGVLEKDLIMDDIAGHKEIRIKEMHNKCLIVIDIDGHKEICRCKCQEDRFHLLI